MKLRQFQIDAFTDRLFTGNPAAVCPLDLWPSDRTMQAIAAENNLSETAFFVRTGDGRYDLRWFTPTTEVDLCGHATLASAHVIWNELHQPGRTLRFSTRSGELKVELRDDRIALFLPRHDPVPVDAPGSIALALGRTPLEVWGYGPEERRSYVAVFADEDDIRDLAPDFRRLKEIEGSVVMVTSRGNDCAFVSRFFAPCFGIDEDPVTGSAHSVLAPFWAERLGQRRMQARQVSRRGGELEVEVLEDRVVVSGRAVKFMEATVTTA